MFDASCYFWKTVSSYGLESCRFFWDGDCFWKWRLAADRLWSPGCGERPLGAAGRFAPLCEGYRVESIFEKPAPYLAILSACSLYGIFL